MNFSLILSNNTRSDDYVNATELCKAFGRNVNEWKREGGKEVIEASISKYGVNTIVSKGGRYGGTVVHPVLAVALAQWLSPEFALVVAETFKRYLEGDMSLAEEVAEHQPDHKKIERSIERQKGIAKRKQETSALKEANLNYGYITNGTYLGLLGKKAADLRDEFGCKNPRDKMDDQTLSLISAAEDLLTHALKATGATNNHVAHKLAKQTAIDIKNLYGKYAS